MHTNSPLQSTTSAYNDEEKSDTFAQKNILFK